MNCINRNTTEYKQLLDETKLHPFVLDIKIAKWQDNNSVESFPTSDQILGTTEVNQTLKAVDILSSDRAKQVFEKGKKNGWDLNKILTELQVPKEQKQIILDTYKSNSEILPDNKELDDIVEKRELLDNKNASTELYKTLRKLIPSDIKIKISFGRQGSWNSRTKELTLGITGENQTKNHTLKTLNHELLHSLTDLYLTKYEIDNKIGIDTLPENAFKITKNINLTDNQNKQIKDLIDIYNHIVEKVDFSNYEYLDKLKRFGKVDYFKQGVERDLLGVHELISESFTNPELINILKNEKGIFNKKTTLFKEFLNKIFKLFNINNANLLEDIYSSVENLIENNSSLREEIITSLLADNSFVVEVNVAKEESQDYDMIDITGEGNFEPVEFIPDTELILEEDEDGNIIGTKEILSEKGKKQIEDRESKRKNTQYYSNLTVPGGTNYTENEISTPLITPSIKGHAQFSTDNGIGWFRSDEAIAKADTSNLSFEELQNPKIPNSPFDIEGNKKAGVPIINEKSRRVLELQSDLFQKGRGRKDLAGVDNTLKAQGVSKEEAVAKTIPQNQFLQLLNKDNNWVTFFIKSIIQDSAKKGYEKVLFPKGDTAAKIEGHQTLEEFKKQKEDRIKELEQKKNFTNTELIFTTTQEKPLNIHSNNLSNKFKTKEEADNFLKNNEFAKKNNWKVFDISHLIKNETETIDIEINQLKQELKDVESGQTQLSSIANFYETTVTNILKKNGYNPVEITDEYGNKWNEIEIEPSRDTSTIFLKEKSFEEKMNDLADPNAENILEINQLEEVENQEEVDYGSSNNEVLFANTKKGVYEANEILQNIIDNNVEAITEQGKFFLDKAQKLLGKTGAKVRMRSEKSMRLNGSKDTIMMYESKTNTIYVSEEILSRITPELAVEAFLHEVTHAATVRSYFEAKTFAEIELKKFIDAAYEKYKNLASLTDSNGKEYGFTNQAEFIAEIFTNSEFQDVLRGLDPENQVVEPGFWSKLIDAIRRLFGLAKNEINTDFIDTSLVIKKVEELIETSDPKWKGTIRENPKYNMFEKQETAKQETYRDYAKLETFEERLQYRVDQIKDNIDQNLGKYEKIKSKMKKGDERVKKLKRYTDVLDKLKTELESYDSSENWRAISAYVKNLIGGIESLDAKFAKEDFKNKDIVHTIKMYSQYLDSYSLIEDVQELIADSKQEDGDVGITVEEQNEIENILVNASGKYVQLRKNFHAFVKKGIKQDLNKIKYHPEVETQWKDKLSKEYDENKEILGITEPKTSWISKQMNTTYKVDIQKDVDSATNKLIESIGYDITKGTYFFSSGLNTNSKLVQIFQFMLDEIRRKIIDAVTTKDVQFKKMFEKLSKEKGSTDVLKLYKNIIEFDGDTPILKSDYSIEYKQKYNEFLEKLDKLEKEKGVKSKEYKDTKDKLNKLNKKDFKNDFSNLTKTELEVLNFFKEIIDESSKKTYNIRSLKKFEHGVFYYHLPVVTKTDLERLLSGDVKGTIKDKWKDLTEIRPDEEGFEYANTKNIDIAGNPLYNIRILYRGDIPGKDQSLDLFTIMRMEYLNAVNFEVKTEKELELSSLVDIAKEKNYYRTEGFRNRVLSRFAKRNRASVIKGEESNTHKKLQSMIESNIYNMMTHKAGKIFGKVDTNKAVGFVTSWLAHAGLDMNRHAATANVINAQANMFLETIGKEVISTRNLRRANALYGNDMGNILKDITSAIPKSFTNQVSIMFDTFGYRDIGANSFIRTGIGKSLINTDRGQIMHNTGEHWVQSTLTMAILDGIKVMNANSDFINKEGKVVKTEKEAASLLDMLGLDNPDKKLELNPEVVYTTHTLNVKFEEGGREQIAELIKKKILNSMGNYDPNMQPEAMRHWQGKLLMTFRRFFVPMLTYRYKGMEFGLKSKEELAKEPEKYLSYSHSMKQYEEGIYTTTVRFIVNSVYPSIKKAQFQAISKDFSNLTEYEKANIKRTIVEVSLTMLILPIIRMLLSMMIGAASDDRDHWTNKQVFFWLYQTRRLESELSQFRNLSENFKILKNPIPAARLLEQGSELLIKMVNPFEWGELGDRYESGRKKGDLKIRHDFQKLIPILNKFNVNSEDLFNFQHSKFGQ